MSLPLNLFIRCIVESDLTALIIKGKPREAEIVAAWANIYRQYIDLSYEKEGVYIINLEKEIALLKSLVSEVETAIYFLSITMHEGCIRILKQNGFRDKITEENRMQVLERIQNRLALKKLHLQAIEKEHDEYVKSHKDNEISESYFIRTLIRLAKYQGVGVIRASDINVKEYVILVKDYLEFVKEKEADGKEG